MPQIYRCFYFQRALQVAAYAYCNDDDEAETTNVMNGVLWCILVAYASHMVMANKPVFDLSNNMRLVLLPADTKMGTIIYKLRASDADEDYPIQFRVTGK